METESKTVTGTESWMGTKTWRLGKKINYETRICNGTLENVFDEIKT